MPACDAASATGACLGCHNDSTSIWGSIWRQRLSACQLHFQAQHLLASSHSFASSTSQLPAHAICLWRRRARTPAPREFISRAPHAPHRGSSEMAAVIRPCPQRVFPHHDDDRERAWMDGWMYCRMYHQGSVARWPDAWNEVPRLVPEIHPSSQPLCTVPCDVCEMGHGITSR